ncbi:MAG: group 1 glycosyl transferase [Ignavibacteria bacterium]|nr:MAG: group 1 glycosyl transferase [Ignavibacteria bacterium]
MEMKINTIPTECTLYFTDVCNFSCAGCRRQTVDKPDHKEITLELVKKILDEYPSLKAFCIAGYGEPTLGKHFPEVVNYLIDNDMYVGIITNGSYPDRLLQLKKKPNYISISLYGFTDEQYKSYVGAGVFSKVIDNFKKIKEKFGNVGFSYFLNKDNYRSLDKVLELCDEVQPAFLNLANYLAYDSVETEETKKIIQTTDVDIIKYIEERCCSRKYINARPIYLDDCDLNFECSSYSNSINLDGEGNIGGCQRQIPPSLTYGNIYLEADPYNNFQMQTQRKRINDNQYPHPNCKTCFGRHNPNKIWQKVDSQLSTANIDVAIMLLFHEKVEQTIECIKSFLPSEKKIYVLNNNSSKDSTIKLKSFCKNYNQVQIFDSEKNLGVSVGRNYLLQHTKEEWAFFVDNDIYVTNDDWLQKFYVHQKNEKHVEVFIPRLFNLHENSFVTYYNWSLENNKISYLVPNNGYLSNFPGGASIINRKIFIRLGLYDSEMFVGFEDFEFAIRGLLSNTPVTAKLIDDIELVHDHRKTENIVDKQAVLVRYNEDSHQKSIGRIQQKYPNLNFQHEWRSWVKEQKRKLINHDEYDLFTLTPEYNFGARTKNRILINAGKNIYLKELTKNTKDKLNSFLSKNKFDKTILFQPQEDKSRYRDINFSCEVSFLSSKDLTDFSRTNDINVLLERRGEKRVTEKDKVLLIIDHLLEKQEDPRIILRAVKKNLLLNKDNKVKILSQGRTKPGIDYPEDETSYREWKLNELKLHLASGGFEIVDSEENDLSTILITISLQTEKYKGYLKELNLPEINMHYLICSNEHGKAKLTGGIGSYIEEAQKLFKRNEFGVFLVSKGNMLPENNIIYNERILTFDKFFDNQVINMNETAEMLLKSMQVVQYIYPYLSIVEIQDVEGFGYRVVQAKQSGLIASEILIQIVSHGSKIYLENASQRWLPIINYDVIYKEKIALENADRLAFPTKFIKKLYMDAGYNFLQERAYQLRLPFEFKDFPNNQYKDVDTLIFYGKRYSMKGYDVFSEIVTLLDMEEILGSKIKRIVMIGPFFPEMTKQNKYFELLKKRIEVIEVSTPREEAINFIKKLHSHSVCVLPYKSDNHPYSVLEIVETGCPFIFAKAGGIPELLPEKFHDKLLGLLSSDDLTKKVKTVLFMDNNERYEIYSSVFAEMKYSQKCINKKFNAFNQRHAFDIRYSNSRELTSSLIVLFDSNNTECHYLLLNAINNQSMLPDKLCVVCKGAVDKNNIRKQITEKIVIDFFDFDETYNRTKNNILEFIATDVVAVNGENDIPKNHFIEGSVLYMQIHPEVQCVSGFADVVDINKSIFDSSQVLSCLKPIGETGILEPSGKNVIALESAAFRSSFLKSISGWEEYLPGTDDLLTYIRIRSNQGKIGTIPKALVLRIKQKDKLNVLNKFEFQMRRAVNSAALDKFDTYRLIGMILSNGFAQTSINPAEVGELEKYLITVQMLLLNGKLLEASEVINSIDAGIITQTESLARSQIITLKRKIDALTSKMNIRGVDNNSNNEKELVSVIIPTYNRPQSLLDAIQSVLNQTYDNFEIIVVNDR